MTRMGCKIKTSNRGKLALRLIWRSQFGPLRSWEGTPHQDTPENRGIKAELEAKALLISADIRRGRFDYLAWFPNGRKAHLFQNQKARITNRLVTVESWYEQWIEKQAGRVRVHRVRDYRSQIRKHVLPGRVRATTFGRLPLPSLSFQDLRELQEFLKTKGCTASTVNGVIHSSLRALLRDARSAGLIERDLFDRAFFKPLSQTDTKTSIDPYTPDERESILRVFRRSVGTSTPLSIFSFGLAVGHLRRLHCAGVTGISGIQLHVSTEAESKVMRQVPRHKDPTEKSTCTIIL